MVSTTTGEARHKVAPGSTCVAPFAPLAGGVVAGGQAKAFSTLTPMQGPHKVFGHMPAGRLAGTVRGPFKPTRCCLGGMPPLWV